MKNGSPKNKHPEFRIPNSEFIQLTLPLHYGFFLRPAEAARILRVAQSTIYNMMDDGRLPAVNLNEGTDLRPCLRIPRNAVEAKIREGALRPPALFPHIQGVKNFL